MNILFVCTGNICRSPSAEALLKYKLSQREVSTYHIDSAGVAGYHIGDPPDPRTNISADKYGVKMSGLRARKVSMEDFKNFDVLFAMDRGHYTSLIAQCPPEYTHKIKLFNKEIYGKDEDVADPYYGTQKDFNIMFEKLNHALDIFLSDHT